ncbi:hypothetical protein Tco_1409292 [Tanacetum coccineum]
MSPSGSKISYLTSGEVKLVTQRDPESRKSLLYDVSSSSGIKDGEGIGTEGPQDQTTSVEKLSMSPFGLATVIAREDPEPVEEEISLWKKLAIMILKLICLVRH